MQSKRIYSYFLVRMNVQSMQIDQTLSPKSSFDKQTTDLISVENNEITFCIKYTVEFFWKYRKVFEKVKSCELEMAFDYVIFLFIVKITYNQKYRTKLGSRLWR